MHPNYTHTCEDAQGCVGKAATPRRLGVRRRQGAQPPAGRGAPPRDNADASFHVYQNPSAALHQTLHAFIQTKYVSHNTLLSTQLIYTIAGRGAPHPLGAGRSVRSTSCRLSFRRRVFDYQLFPTHPIYHGPGMTCFLGRHM